MDSYPTRDYLTVNEDPPPLTIRNATRIAFATICSPTTYGVLLHKELTAKGKEHEYLATRNAAILRRECLRTDFLNPVISNRTSYLKAVSKLLSRLERLTEIDLIAQQYSDFFASWSESSANALNSTIREISSLSEYYDRNGPRLSLALSYKSSNAETAKVLSDYERTTTCLALQLMTLDPIFQSVLLDEGYLSCRIVLTNNDLETRFFPILLDREKSLILLNFKSHGYHYEHVPLQGVINDHFVRHWKSLITIDRHNDSNYFHIERNNKFDEFRLLEITNDQQSTESETKPPKLETSLMNLMLHGDSPIQKTQSIESPTQPLPESLLNQIQRDYTPIVPGTSTTSEQSLRLAIDAHLRSLDVTNTGKQPLTQDAVAEASTINRSQTNSTPKAIELSEMCKRPAQYAKRLARTPSLAVNFKTEDRHFRIIRANASQSPDKQRPGDVVHVRVTSRRPYIDGTIDLYFKRFTVSDDNKTSLYLTRQNQFQQLLEMADAAEVLSIHTTRGTQKELVEITKAKTNSWFSLTME